MRKKRRMTMQWKTGARILCAILFFVIIASSNALLPGGEINAADRAGSSNMLRAFHVDNGRKYFSVGELKGLIDEISKDNYTHMELAVGNDGMRFLLNDMSLEVGDKTYTSSEVKDAIHAGNLAYNTRKSYSPSKNELTESEMDELIQYAKNKNIEIIPLVNTPGHMNAIVTAMEELGLENVRFASNGRSSAETVNLENEEAKAFTQAFLQKYMNYFAGKGCTYFNLGCDEYAMDISVGFQGLINKGIYYKFIIYLNELADMVKTTGMTPMSFNDGIYYNNRKPPGHVIDTDILIAYWHSGWSGYNPRAAYDLADDGFRIINTSNNWYLVPEFNNKFEIAMNGVRTTAYDQVIRRNNNHGIPEVEGCMLCLWSDIPKYSYPSWEERVRTWIATFAERNPKIFGISAPNGKTLTYNGRSQIGVAESNRLELTGNRATNAGEYEATAAPVTGCVWYDEGCGSQWNEANAKAAKKIPYTIRKATLTASYQSEKITWYGKPSYIVRVRGFVNGENAGTAGGYVAPKVASVKVNTHKTYTLTPSGGKAANYNFKYEKGTLTVGCKGILMQKSIWDGKTLKISWNAVSGAQLYEVYAAPCNSNGKKYALTLRKRLKASDARNFNIKGLKASSYKVRVYAYRTIGGKKVCIATSNLTHIKLSKTGKDANATGMKLSKTKATLAKGKTLTLKGTAVVPKGRTLFYKHHCEAVTYVTDDAHIATVNAKTGKITGVSKGICRIYAIAPNGVKNVCTLTVR